LNHFYKRFGKGKLTEDKLNQCMPVIQIQQFAIKVIFPVVFRTPVPVK